MTGGQDTKQIDMSKGLSMNDLRASLKNTQLYSGYYGDVDSWKKEDLIKGVKELRASLDIMTLKKHAYKDHRDILLKYYNLPWYKKIFRLK